MLAEVIWIGVLVSTTVATLPNWPDSYGDMKIPYPFGIIEGYLKDTAGRDFSINCDTSSSKTQPKTRNVVVTNISIQCEIDIMTYNGFDCYDQLGKPLASNNQQHSGFLVSQFLSLKKTSSWLLVVTLTHTLMVIWTMNPSPSTACPNVKTNTM